MNVELFYLVYLKGLQHGLSCGMSLGCEKIQKIVEAEREKTLKTIGNDFNEFSVQLISMLEDEAQNKAVEAIKEEAKKQMEERQKKFVGEEE